MEKVFKTTGSPPYGNLNTCLTLPQSFVSLSSQNELDSLKSQSMFQALTTQSSCFLTLTRHSHTSEDIVKPFIRTHQLVLRDGCGFRGLLRACPLPDCIKHRCNYVTCLQLIIIKTISGIFLVVADTALFVINIGNTWSA